MPLAAPLPAVLLLALLASAAPDEPPAPSPWREGHPALHVFTGEAAGDQFGYEASAAGDVDGDGVTDIVIGAPLHRRGERRGKVYLFSGRDGALLWSRTGEPGEFLGWSVAGAGDVDGDGAHDVIVGAPQLAGGPGRAYVLAGGDGTPLHRWDGAAAGDRFGDEVETAGDVDGDGHADLIVGASRTDAAAGDDAPAPDAGSAHVYSGADGSELLALRGPSAGAQLGAAVHGDAGLLVIGAPGANGTGRVFVHRARDGELLHAFDNDAGGVALGSHFVAITPDVDGDGAPDVYATDWQHAGGGSGRGRAFLWSGTTGEAIHVLDGARDGDGFGIGDALAGDVDGDGRADLVVGAWTSGDAAPGGGRVDLLSGADGALLQRWTGQVPGETLGFDATGLGDVDGDDRADFLVSAASAAILGPDTGAVYVLSGAPSTRGEPAPPPPRARPAEVPLRDPSSFAEDDATILHEWRGEAPGGFFGWVARRAGDLDGDGVIDAIVSAHQHGGGRGKAYAYSSASGELLWSVTGEPGELLGFAVSAAGDVDGDGTPDVALGAPSNSQPGAPGRVLLVSGADGALLRAIPGTEPGAQFGSLLAGDVDLDGDGAPDLAVGAPAAGGGAGAVLVHATRDGRELWRASGEPGDALGISLAASADGPRALLAAGATGAGANDTGQVRVWSGWPPAPAFTLDADATGRAYGYYFTSFPGDFDADGVPDLFTVDFSNAAKGPNTGRAYLHAGADGELLRTFTGDDAGDGLGIGVSRVGDVDGDGLPDLLVGAWLDADAANQGGSATLFSGADGAVLQRFTNTAPLDQFGYDTDGLGDVDGDGIPDFLVTSANSGVGGPSTGRVFVLKGAPQRE